jgi:hypothetical protein
VKTKKSFGPTVYKARTKDLEKAQIKLFQSTEMTLPKNIPVIGQNFSLPGNKVMRKNFRALLLLSCGTSIDKIKSLCVN